MQMKQVSLQLSCQIRKKERRKRREGGRGRRRKEGGKKPMMGMRGRVDGLVGVVCLLYSHMFGITTRRNLVIESI
jgi:hypothetical protein